MVALAVCAVVLLKIPMLSFFSSQLIEERIGSHRISKLCDTEPVVRHFFTSLDTHDAVGTGKSGYLRQNLRIYFLTKTDK
jgi:hypothetical protein